MLCLNHTIKAVDMKMNGGPWTAFMTSQHPYPDLVKILGARWDSLSGLHRLLLIKTFMSEKVVISINDFILERLGPDYVDVPPLNLPNIFADSSCGTPVLFVLGRFATPPHPPPYHPCH